MTAPLFDAPSGLLAIPVGIAFGATLERAGLGRARTIADQLSGRDFTVLKVMFSAIVTAMLGIFWASRLGWLDLSRVAIPSTDILPQAIGAILFGAGFALASLCPGTACVSAATGTRDGLAVIGGLFAGTLVTSLFWTQLGRIAELAPRDGATLPADVGLSTGVIVALITIAALVTIPVSDRIAARLSRAGHPLEPARWRLSPLAAIALALGTLAAASGTPPQPADGAVAGAAARAAGAPQVGAVTLAEWIRSRKPSLRIVDVRIGLAPDDYRIPGAVDVPLPQIAELAPRSGETLVLYSDDGTQAVQAWAALRSRGVRDVFVLENGLASWEDEILAPALPSPDDTAALRQFPYRRELAAWFGGRPADRPAASRTDLAGAAGQRARRKRTC